MHGADFAANPHLVYDQLRAQGPAAPVELAPGVNATLVTGYETALRVLQSPQLFVRDSRRWKDLNEGRISLDSPVLPMMAYRPNCLFTDGAVHLRLRKAVTESLDRLNITRIRRDVEPIAAYLIDQFSERGRADLLHDYAKLLPLLLFNKLFGCPAGIGDRLTGAMAALFEAQDPNEALRANEELNASLMELIALKRREPGDDMTSWLIQHGAGLTDEELKDQLVMLMGAGIEPERNLISNTLLTLLTEASSGRGTGMLIEEALDHVLWNDPPIANYATHFPVQDVDLGGTVVEAGSPVVISFAGANTDPALKEARQARSAGAQLGCPGDRGGGGRGDPQRPARPPARGARRAAGVAAGPLPPGARGAAGAVQPDAGDPGGRGAGQQRRYGLPAGPGRAAAAGPGRAGGPASGGAAAHGPQGRLLEHVPGPVPGVTTG
jgi:cytochrome P450